MAELVVLSEDDWDSITLRYLAERPAFQLQTHESFVEQIAFEASQHRSKSRQEFLAAIWRLVARELIYIDLGAVDTYAWTLRISQRGTEAARDPATSPDAPDFLPLMWQRTPGASEIVKAYANEAVETYRRHSLLASVVLLGIATEAAFTDLGKSFKGWLSGEARTKFADAFDRDSLTASRKWDEFRRRLEPRKPDLPDDVRDALPVVIDAVAHLLRQARNEHAHPKKITIDRETQYVNLRVFAVNTEWTYRLKKFFDEVPPTTP